MYTSLDEFVDLIDVENNFVFQPRDGLTFCNCYAKVVLAYLGVYIPNRKVNDLYDWLHTKPKWVEEVIGEETMYDAVIAIAHREPHGHIAVKLTDGSWTWAGAHNKKSGTLAQAFGNTNDVKILYHVL